VVRISLQEVEHRYGNRPVLSIPAFAIEAGSVAAVVGPNGAGKSTLLRLLACLEVPSRGAVHFDGQPLRRAADFRRARRRVTLVEQRPFLFAGSVAGNLAYALRLHGVRGPAATARIERALERLGVGVLRDRDARSLSEGELQKVAVARALALEPDALLLDEPASGADPGSTGLLYQALSEERQRGAALCFASHQLEDAYRWSDRVVALAAGRLAPVTPENLFRVDIPPGTGPRTVRVGPLALQVYTDRTGPAIIALPPEDIVVSTEPFHSSARNQFHGRVRRISEDGRGGVTLVVDAGVDLTVRLTHVALADLGLTLGSPVVLSIKAMSVRVF
jgi:molybdopterin-binding protein